MKRWQIQSFGDIDNLQCDDVPAPEPGPRELLIRVRACGINHADLLLVSGRYQSLPSLPFGPGSEVCGIVEAVGTDADPAWLDQRVIAYCEHSGLSELATAPAEACCRAPETLSDSEAAGFLVAHGSVEVALVRRARLAAGEWLGVLGAGSGVGLTGVEIGAAMGAQIVAIARGEAKQEAARKAGAAAVLDPEAFDLETTELRERIKAETGGHGLDVLFDPVGGALAKAAGRAVGFEGRILPFGFASGGVPEYKANHLLVKNIDVIGVWWGGYFGPAPKVIGDSIARLLALIERGKIRPVIGESVPFLRAPDALKLMKERRNIGKIVVNDF